MSLNAGVSIDQALDLMIQTYVPAFEKNFPGVKVYMAKGVRGENPYRINEIVIMDNDGVRNRYFDAEGAYCIIQ